MNMTEPKQIYTYLIQHWNLESEEREVDRFVGSVLVPSHIDATTPMYLLILDEIDQLATKHKDVLYSFFEWAKSAGSRLVLIGIANQLDLTTKLLPRLQTKNCEPVYLSFDPYKVPEITAIIKDRLSALEDPTPDSPTKKFDQNGKPVLPIMQPMAVELAARKLAGTGDVRKALDVCRYVVLM
jgi:cell division control protein 6